MPTNTSINTPSTKKTSISLGAWTLDSWALIVAVALALLVRFNILKNVPW
ncbi:MAG: hypothetical protein WBZ14_19695 [Terriglobales bacterium]